MMKNIATPASAPFKGLLVGSQFPRHVSYPKCLAIFYEKSLQSVVAFIQLNNPLVFWYLRCTNASFFAKASFFCRPLPTALHTINNEYDSEELCFFTIATQFSAHNRD
jgi:hypothetical protein